MRIIIIFLLLFVFANTHAQNIETTLDKQNASSDAFYNNPEEEFLKGYTKVFDVAGHEKSNGTDWSLKIPLSWKAVESEEPNIIQEFISEEGKGKESVTLMLMDLPIEDQITERDIKGYFTARRMKKHLPENSRFKKAGKMTFDGINGGFLEYELPLEYSNLNASVFMSSFIYDKKLYLIFCGVKRNSHESKDIERFSKLFRLITSSIMVKRL
ncbi:hypothetical protein [uncultured Flavobacterium sp.]|uniref:hypothetical protein n=1 Tax=uncultured Flavobacterium sp. TaxID=165435 RepID=UPI0025F85620|nr:hypothetical protein [uncultured Flavobacterium sp.]